MPAVLTSADPRDYCAIDFGTSNSAVAVPTAGAMELVPLEPQHGERGRTMPTAVFYVAEGKDLHALPKLYGRAAIAAYVDGTDGRLMRSMKSVLGSALMEQHTDIGAGRSVAFGDVIASYLLHLKRAAQAHAGREIERVVLGRPVFFVDDDPARDAAAQASLEAAARTVGFKEVRFQYEPIAAAFHYEEQVAREQTVLVPTSAAARPTSPSCAWAPTAAAGPTAAPTSSPATACTSPAPTSTAASSSTASCPRSATAPTARSAATARRWRCPAASTSTSPPGT